MSIFNRIPTNGTQAEMRQKLERPSLPNNIMAKAYDIGSLMPILAAYRNFFFFFLISSHVGFVPVSDVLAIFVSDRRCEFW